MLLIRVACLLLLVPTTAHAARATTTEALARLEETLTVRLESNGQVVKGLLPAMVVSVAPAYDETKAWYPTAALATLVRVFGAASLRSCEACMAPRMYVEEGRIEQITTQFTTADLTRVDEGSRGSSAPARTAIWLDETTSGVSLRMIDLENSRIVLADNFDPMMLESARTNRSFSMALELERRARRDSLTHAFVDLTMYPGQHFSLDWTDQWGDTNANLSGVSFSLFNPILAFGGAYYRVIPSALNLSVGAKVLMSLPTALVRSISDEEGDIIDPLLTGVFVVRLPIGSSNYGITLTASTNGVAGIGVSLMNTSLLPFLP